MTASPHLYVLVTSIGLALVASACSADAGRGTASPASVQAPSASPGTPPAANADPTPAVIPSAETPIPASTLPDGVTPLDAGSHAAQVMGTGTYPGYTVSVPDGWYDAGGRFVIKYPTDDLPAPVLGLSVWDVSHVYRDPCRWLGTEVEPGPGVDDLVAALVAQPTRNATKPIDVTIAGYSGRYFEWSVPTDIKSSTWTNFDDCDVEPSNGARDFRSWVGNGMGTRYQQVPGQVDRLWVLDIGGQRLVVDATYSPDTTQADRELLQRIVESIRFVAP